MAVAAAGEGEGAAGAYFWNGVYINKIYLTPPRASVLDIIIYIFSNADLID